MALRTFTDAEALSAAVGEIVGPSRWVDITQDLIDRFADDTGDHDWIHVDVARAAESDYGTTIAHGFLSLSLIGRFSPELIAISDLPNTLNYGLDRVRFPAPCPTGSRVRATAEVADVVLASNGVRLTLRYAVEREGGTKPVCVADQISWRHS